MAVLELARLDIGRGPTQARQPSIPQWQHSVVEESCITALFSACFLFTILEPLGHVPVGW